MGAAGSSGSTAGYQLWAWGQGEGGQLGNGSVSQKTSAIQVGSEEYWLGRDPDDDKSIKLVNAQQQTLAVNNEGKLFAWGNNGYGRLGNGSTTNTSSPVQIGALTTWDNVAAASTTSAAIKTDGTLWTWGRGASGKLGNGSLTDLSSPAQVGSLTNWALVRGGYDSFSAIKTDGTLWSWGANAKGQLGDGSTTGRSSPVQIGSLTTWAQVAVATYVGAAIKTDGTLWVWGENGVGQLGTNNTTDYSSPVQVGSLTTWAEVSYHYGHTTGRGGWMAVKTDGTLWGTGTQTSTFAPEFLQPLSGEIGVGNTTTYSSPVQVGSLTDWKHVTTGWYTTMALKTDGTLWVWGRGYYGTGNGNNTAYSSPVQVGSDTAWEQIGDSAQNSRWAMRT
mgnify:CR=1 FL=1